MAIANPTRAGGSLVRSLLLTMVLVVMGLALLYAYRAQTPAVQTVAYSQAIQEISAGQVVKATITGSKAMLELRSGEKQQTIVPEPPTSFQKALDDYSSANPSRPIAVEYAPDSSGLQVIGSILLTVLPLLLIGAFFAYSLRKRSR